MPSSLAKRALDMVGASVLLLAAAPLLAAAAAVLLVAQGRPLLFRQLRPGLQGKPFTLYKLRTMTEARDAHGTPLPDAARLTQVGRWVRRTGLDELPELWNVLRGDMSLVGPRPLLMEYLDRYTPVQARRHEVKPGIAGWAIVQGRNALSWEEKFACDVWYVEHQSMVLDLRILWLTFLAVLRGRGVSAAGHATMPTFEGTRQGVTK